ncbi:MAG: hypothetical protein C4527_10220 [Candidatus Omnitrophota bacterium]|nr:MAG: hypothetical protein C4527_10220 [Candidatus Omnitrophota bacterium]
MNNKIHNKKSRLFMFIFVQPIMALMFIFTSHAQTTITSSQQEIIRNGNFEQKETAWAKNINGVGSYLDNGLSGAGMRLNPTIESQSQGYIVQELNLITHITQATFSMSYRFDISVPEIAMLAAFRASILSEDNEAVSQPVYIDINSFPGYEWQNVYVALDAGAIEQINVLHAQGKRIYLLIDLIGEWIHVIVDNISLTISGQMQFPELTGEIAYIEDGKAIHRINPIGGNDQVIWRNTAEVPQLYDIAWNPQSTLLAFTSNHEFGKSRFTTDIYTIRPDGSNICRVTNSPSPSELPENIASGTITGSVHNNTGQYRFALVYVQGAQESVQLSAMLGPDQSGSDTQSFTISVPDLGPDVEQTITVWSEGYAESRSTVNVIANETLDVGTLELHGFTSRYTASQLTWNGLGNQIGFVLDGLLRSISLPTDYNTLDQELIGGVNVTKRPSWSPIGDQLLYEKSSSVVLSDAGIYLAAPGEQTGRQLIAPDASSSSPGDPAWLPDGSGFFFAMSQMHPRKMNNSGYDLFHYDFVSTQITPITNFFNETVESPTPSPDGHYIAFIRVSTDGNKRDIWVVNRYQPTIMWQLTGGIKPYRPNWSRQQPQVSPEPTPPVTGVEKWQNY